MTSVEVDYEVNQNWSSLPNDSKKNVELFGQK